MTKENKLHLTLLESGMPGLTPAWAKVLCEAAAVCLEEKKHKTGVTLFLSGLTTETILLEWNAVDEQQRKAHKDIHEATEYGACGLAILLVKKLTGKVVLERSYKGSGFDYWLGDENHDSADLFAGKARLEVSGMLEGNKNALNARVKQKKSQIQPSRHLAPGFVAVTEFSNPMAHVEVA
ncbi:MAG: hypothetical protein SFT92_04995 [Rickettsiales bacterium]|nr:hypothetical protein [Rickettsiales bacterium]